MKTVVVGLPGSELLTASVVSRLAAQPGSIAVHHFPDGEIGVRLLSDVRGCGVVVVAALDRPSTKILSLYFLLELLRSSGAKHLTLLAPYLPYMRQDKQFHDGEAVTSRQFARLLSGMVDRLVTVDPHLHRYSKLDEIYSIPSAVVHAAGHIARWINENVEKPIIIGPDSESKQWVSSVAQEIGAPYVILEKERLSDVEVHLYMPARGQYDAQHTPVLVDDIISTAHTMIESARVVAATAMQKPVCVGVHAVFAHDAFAGLKAAGVDRIVTTNTLPHETNAIDLTDVMCEALLQNA